MVCQEKLVFHLATEQLRFLMKWKVDLVRPNCSWQAELFCVEHDTNNLVGDLPFSLLWCWEGPKGMVDGVLKCKLYFPLMSWDPSIIQANQEKWITDGFSLVLMITPRKYLIIGKMLLFSWMAILSPPKHLIFAYIIISQHKLYISHDMM